MGAPSQKVEDDGAIRDAHVALQLAQRDIAAEVRALRQALAESSLEADRQAAAHQITLEGLEAAASKRAGDDARILAEVRSALSQANAEAAKRAEVDARVLAEARAALGRQLEQDASLSDRAAAAENQVKVFRQRLCEQGVEISTLGSRLQAAEAKADELARDRSRLVDEAAASGFVFEALRSELATVRRDLEEERTQVAHLSANMKDHIERLRIDGAALLLRERVESASRVSRLEAEAQSALEAERTASGAVLSAMRASTSWRLTRPLRSIAFRMRRLAGR